jgi:hypothetical protein
MKRSVRKIFAEEKSDMELESNWSYFGDFLDF